MQDTRYQNILQNIHFGDLPSRADGAYVVVSYPDDEAVKNNNGRAGAAAGPERIIHFLGRLPLHLEFSPKIFVLPLVCDSKISLKLRHEKAEAQMLELFQKGYRVISLGGGHDYGYPDAAAYYQNFQAPILNVDAHLDVRECDLEKINSGTPFYRFAERFGGQFILQWGTQKASNSEKLFSYAEQSGMKIYDWQQPAPKLSGSLGLSICLDAFDGIRGVSAPAVVGLKKSSGIELVREYSKNQNWLGIYECAPSLDSSAEDSARFAARLIWEWIEAGGLKE